MAKDRMIEALGEGHLLLPGLLARALAGNDRVKYLLTLLQTARTAADGAVDAPSLREERLACGVEDPLLDRVVAESARENGGYRIPGAEALAARAIDEVHTMLAPLKEADPPVANALAQRVATLSEHLSIGGDRISAEDVARLDRGART